jgi:DNA-binding PadR family transcriptional regulator
MDPTNLQDVKKFFESYKKAKPSKSSELYILGYLSHSKLSGYDIYKLISKTADTGGAWLKLNKATVYNTLNRMKDEGLIEIAETLREKKRPIKDIYRITDSGKDLLRQLVLQDLQNLPVMLINFTPALFFSQVLSSEELHDALNDKIEQVKFIIGFYKNVSRISQGAFTDLIVENKIDTYEAMLKYLKKVLKLVEQTPMDDLIKIDGLDSKARKRSVKKFFPNNKEE